MLTVHQGLATETDGLSEVSLRMPSLLLLDAGSLAGSKQAFVVKHLHQDALRDIYFLADQALTMPALSVTQNTPHAVSGDPHDYFSVGPYWWPDPSKKDGLPWINRDGEANPMFRGEGSDTRLFQKLLQSVRALSLAYYFSDNQAYANKAIALLQTWFIEPATRMNPHLNYAQSIPGITHGRGIGIIDWRGIPYLLDSMTLLHSRQTPQFQQAMDQWLAAFLSWLRDSNNGQQEANMHNNHGTYYDVIVASIALYLGKDEIARNTILHTQNRMLAQITEQGAQPHELTRTKPFHYAAFNLLAFTQMATLASNIDLDLWHFPSQQDQRLYQAYQFMVTQLDNKTLWPGKQEHELPLHNLVGISMLMQQQMMPEQYLTALISQTPGKQQAQQCALLFNVKLSATTHSSAEPDLCLH